MQSEFNVSTPGENGGSYQLLRENISLPSLKIFSKLRLEREKTKFKKIRCPLCGWRPRKKDLWSCGPNESPEGFLKGCFTSWNTFLTHGQCPGCLHQWKWTCCLACSRWSLHEDWYEKTP